MKKYLVLIIILTVLLSGCKQNPSMEEGSILNISVSIEPEKTFVERVVGDLAKVTTIIPQGYSPANYQPSPQEIQKISDAQLYFSIGVESEKTFILPKLKDINKDIKVVSLLEEVMKSHSPIYIEENHDGHDHEAGDIDPHIWLSPKRVITMVETIKNTMIELDEKNEGQYTNNAQEYIEELEKLDKELEESLSNLENKSFIIYHSALSYFADDYNLEMITIEEKGKEATAKRIQRVVDLAKEKNIKVIFYQDEFDSSQAKIIAEEIDGQVIEVSPLSGDYINNMREIKEKFTEVLK